MEARGHGQQCPNIGCVGRHCWLTLAACLHVCVLRSIMTKNGFDSCCFQFKLFEF